MQNFPYLKMKHMKVIIIEDEAYAADILETLVLEVRPETEVLASYNLLKKL